MSFILFLKLQKKYVAVETSDNIGVHKFKPEILTTHSNSRRVTNMSRI